MFFPKRIVKLSTAIPARLKRAGMAGECRYALCMEAPKNPQGKPVAFATGITENVLLFIGILTVVFSSGCAAYLSRYDLITNRRTGDPVTPYFSGSATDIRGVHSGITAPFRSRPDEQTPKKSTRTSEFVSTIYYLVDLPFSLVLDILIIPSDRQYIKRNRSEGKLLDSLMKNVK